MYFQNIGGHGFWGRGGVYTGGVSEKISAPTPGGGIFFQGSILLVDPGVILPKIVKLGVPSGPPGAPPCLLRQGGVSGDFRFWGGVQPPHTPPPCPCMFQKYILQLCNDVDGKLHQMLSTSVRYIMVHVYCSIVREICWYHGNFSLNTSAVTFSLFISYRLRKIEDFYFGHNILRHRLPSFFLFRFWNSTNFPEGLPIHEFQAYFPQFKRREGTHFFFLRFNFFLSFFQVHVRRLQREWQ